MDRGSERERSSRRSHGDRDRDRSAERDQHRDRDRDRSIERDHHRDRDHKHRRHRHGEERRREPKDDRRREDSPPDPERRRDRSSSRARGSVDRDGGSREESVERGHVASRKRRDRRDESPEPKRARVSEGTREERRERRRFEDRAADESGGERNGVYKEEKKKEEIREKDEALSDVEEKKTRRRERRFSDNAKLEDKRDGDETMEVGSRATKEERKFKDKIKEEDLASRDSKSLSVGVKLENGGQKIMDSAKSGSAANAGTAEPLSVPSKVSMASAVSHDPIPKVSSITTTNENEGVNITRSDEVTGKFSTDGTSTSGAGKNGSLSLDALAKAKKALQIQKEISEKLKKIPTLNKLATTSSGDKSHALSSKDGLKVTPPVFATQPGSSISTPSSAVPASSISSTQALPVGITVSQGPSAGGGTGVLPPLTAPSYEAVRRAQELAAKMGFRQDPEFAPLINMFSAPAAVESVSQRPAKAPVLRLDAQGREVDEHGNVISTLKPTNLSTLKVNINKQKKEAFQILRPELEVNVESNPHFDPSMGINKTKLLRPKRAAFQFVEEGKWQRQAEIIKFKNQFGEAQAKELKMKQSQLNKLKGEPDINPNLIQVSERVKREKEEDKIPDIEWWDVPLLPCGAYTDVGNGKEKLNMEKITIYVEHPRPIEPPAEPAPPPPQPLKLTKKEQKKLRTQRRLAKEKDRQEMIRQGMIEPPKPKVKMSNLMKVLGSEATQDPTRLEMEIRSAAAEREQAHVDRNIARKLTPAERREKKERKLFEDPNTLETLVSVYKVNNLAHRQTRFKVDVNAQENRLTGCAVISDDFCIVVVEGGKKPIKRYGKLMLKRINWAAAVDDEEEDGMKLDAPPNRCVLVWLGSVAKPSFNRFTVQKCISEAAARKVFADAGVPHYWDLAANFSDELL